LARPPRRDCRARDITAMAEFILKLLGLTLAK